MVAELGGAVPLSARASVALQEHKTDGGITDIHLRDPGRLEWILEAKLGFAPPGIDQLTKYARRLLASEDQAASKLLVVLAKSDRRDLWLQLNVPTSVEGVPVKVMSWGQVMDCSEQARQVAGNIGKGLLWQLENFLEGILAMQMMKSNEVFVVSASRSIFNGGTTSFIDVIQTHQKYIHPIGAGWPINPPNYMAFRWDSRLQSIHHVDHYEVITDFGPFFPGVPSLVVDPHFLYHLGPPMVPNHTVATGDIYPSGRVWAHLDLLLTCSTIYEDRNKTKEREAAAKKSA